MYDHAVKEERAGRGVILYFDESYVDKNGHLRYSFVKKGCGAAAVPKGTGQRIVIMACITKEGVLAELHRSPDGKLQYVQYVDNLTDTPAMRTARKAAQSLPCLSIDGKTSIHLFELKHGKADYHVDGAKILSYFRNLVKPLVDKLYPNKKVFVVMDNASTHLKRASTNAYFDVLGTPKRDLGVRMKDVMSAVISRKGGLRGGGKGYLLPVTMNRTIGGVATTKTVTFFMGDGNVPRDAVRYDSSISAQKTNFNAPYVHELQNAAIAWLKVHAPSYLISELQQWAAANKWCIIYSVPYAPDSQPIEMTWSHVKYIVRSLYTRHENRTFALMAARICNAFVTSKWARSSNSPVCAPGDRAAATCRRAMRYTSSSLSKSTTRAGETIGSYAMSAEQQARMDAWKGSEGDWTEYYMHLK